MEGTHFFLSFALCVSGSCSAFSLLLNKFGITRTVFFLSFFHIFSTFSQLFIVISRRKTSRTTKCVFVLLNIFILLPFAVWMTKPDSKFVCACYFNSLLCSSLSDFKFFPLLFSAGFGFEFFICVYINEYRNSFGIGFIQKACKLQVQ